MSLFTFPPLMRFDDNDDDCYYCCCYINYYQYRLIIIYNLFYLAVFIAYTSPAFKLTVIEKNTFNF